MIKNRGEKGKLMLNFDGLNYFGTPNKTKVVYLQLKDKGPQYELLTDVIDFIVKSFLKHNVININEVKQMEFKKD